MMKNTQNTIGISATEYQTINYRGKLTKQQSSILQTYFSQHEEFAKIFLFGNGRTGQAVKECLGDRVCGFLSSASLHTTNPEDATAILITTAPIHSAQVIKALIDSPLASLPVIELFTKKDIDIRLILETQPRSGTDYTIKNLKRSLNLGYASVFDIQSSKRTADNLLFYEPSDGNGYIVKSHFTHPLHYPQYRYVQTLFLFSYFPDTYYKWARMYAPPEEKSSFYLTASRPEWQVVRSYIPLHLKWLSYIADKNYIRFEDYCLNLEGTLDTFEKFLGARPLDFSPPTQSAFNRLYWNNDYTRCFDRRVADTLLEAFAGPIAHFYPEKASALSRKI